MHHIRLSFKIKLVLTLALFISAVALSTIVALHKPPEQPHTQVSAYASNSFITVLYESTTQHASNGASALTFLKALKAQFVFRGMFQWGATSPVASDFTSVKDNIAQLRGSLSGLVYEGGIGAQYFDRNSTWPNGSPVSTTELNSVVGRDKQG